MFLHSRVGSHKAMFKEDGQVLNILDKNIFFLHEKVSILSHALECSIVGGSCGLINHNTLLD